MGATAAAFAHSGAAGHFTDSTGLARGPSGYAGGLAGVLFVRGAPGRGSSPRPSSRDTWNQRRQLRTVSRDTPRGNGHRSNRPGARAGQPDPRPQRQGLQRLAPPRQANRIRQRGGGGVPSLREGPSAACGPPHAYVGGAAGYEFERLIDHDETEPLVEHGGSVSAGLRQRWARSNTGRF